MSEKNFSHVCTLCHTPALVDKVTMSLMMYLLLLAPLFLYSFGSAFWRQFFLGFQGHLLLHSFEIGIRLKPALHVMKSR